MAGVSLPSAPTPALLRCSCVGSSAVQFGTAPFCAGECNVGDRVMARAQSSSNVPSDQGGRWGAAAAAAVPPSLPLLLLPPTTTTLPLDGNQSS